MASRRKHESGQVVVLTAGAIVFLIGFAALATDVGFLYATRRNMQTVADAAAIAGSNALQAGQTFTQAQSAAQDVATVNGYSNGVNDVTVTVGHPATNPNPTTGTYVEVDVTRPVPTYFMRVLGFDTVNVGATAVSGGISGPACVYALDPSANGAITVTGSANVTANCGVIDESSSGSALTASGSAGITASSIGVVGGSSSSSSVGFTPTPITGIAPSFDPLAYLQPLAPTPGTCVAGADATTATSGNGGTISQGTYCSGIKVSGGHTLNFNPGLYVLNGGGLDVSGGSNIIGTGVTFYNTGTSSTYKPITISGGSTTSLAAPTNGTFEGILLFQDPDNTKSAAISGGSGTVIQGALYFPGAHLDYSGGSSATAYTMLVSKTLTLSGSSTITLNNDFSSLADGSPIKTSALYE